MTVLSDFIFQDLLNIKNNKNNKKIIKIKN